MKIESKYELDKVVSDDDTREVLQHAWLNVEKKHAVSTNGRSMAIVPVKIEEGDTTGYIPTPVFKDIRKNKKNYYELKLNGNCKFTCGNYTSEYNRLHADFTRYDHVIPKKELGENEIYVEFGINPELLLNLAKGLGNPENVTLKLKVNLEKQEYTNVIEVKTDNESYGLIMPMQLQ